VRFVIPDNPLFTLEVLDESIGLEGYVCIHSIGRDGSSGGMRCVDDISKAEVKLLARAMSFKYSYFGIKQGGAKAGLRLPYGAPPSERQRLIAAMATHLEPLIKRSNIWSVWTDMNFFGGDLQHFFSSIGVPWQSSGTSGSTIRTGITGAWSVEAAAMGLGLRPHQARIAIEGYGGVAQVASAILAPKGFRIVALSNHLGAVYDDRGLDLREVQNAKAKFGNEWVVADGPWSPIGHRDMLQVPCEILVPGARVHSIDIDLAGRLDTRAVVPVANVPCTDAALAHIESRGIFYLPDYVVNGGGVCGWIESEHDSFGERFRDMITRVLRLQETTGRSARALCDDIAHAGFAEATGDAYLHSSVGRKLLHRVTGLPGVRSLVAKRWQQETSQRMGDRMDSLYR
jgi:glutamate dehydrogenase (NAD(P)+)